MIETVKLSTDDIVHYIRDYTTIRDEIFQVIRQYGIDRESKPSLTELADPGRMITESQEQLSEIRGRLQQNRAELESVEREVDRVRKEAGRIEQLSGMGFEYQEITRQMPGYKRILGLLPDKKMPAAQKALDAIFQERAIVASGTRKQDTVHVLVVVPTESYSQTLQTLLQYNFTQLDMPELSDDNPVQALGLLLKKGEELANHESKVTDERDGLRKESAAVLNRLADKVQDVIMILRAALRLGEGTNAALIVARLEKPPSPELVGILSRDTVFEEEVP
jgi:hypothetical protein